MHGKTHENIKPFALWRTGCCISNSEYMIRESQRVFLRSKRLFHLAFAWLSVFIWHYRSWKRAVRDSAEHANAKEVYLIHEPMAPAWVLVSYFGTERKHDYWYGWRYRVTVLAMGGIVCEIIKVAGDVFTNDIANYMGTQPLWVSALLRILRFQSALLWNSKKAQSHSTFKVVIYLPVNRSGWRYARWSKPCTWKEYYAYWRRHHGSFE